MSDEQEKPYEVLPFVDGGVIGDIEYNERESARLLAAGGWCAPSDQIYSVLPEQVVTIDLEDGGIYWTNATFDSPLFVALADRHNRVSGSVLNVPRGGLLPDMWEPFPEVTVTRGFPSYTHDWAGQPHASSSDPFEAHRRTCGGD